MDPADADPALQRGHRHRQLSSQVRQQPLVLTQDARFHHGPGTRTPSTAPGEQTGHDAARECRRALRGMKALAIQLLGYRGPRLSRLAELVDSAQEPLKV